MAETRVTITAEANQAIREFDRLRTEGSASLQQLAAAGGQLNRTTVSAAQTAFALRQVPAQFTDIVVSLQAGQAPLTVLLQQGGQLRDMFGSAGGAARALGGYVLGLVNPYTVVGAVVVGLTLAHRAGAAEAEGYARALITTNNAAGSTSDGMADMARNVGKVTGSQHEAAAAVTALAMTGRVSAQDLQRFTAVAIGGQQVLGRAVQDTVGEFAEIGRAPVAALEKLNEKYNFITAATYAQVKALKDAGRESAAASLAQNAFADGIAAQHDKVLATLSDWELGWMRIKKASSGVLDDVINLAMGRQQTNDQKITGLLTERELIEKRIAVAVTKGDAEKEKSFRADLVRNAASINQIRTKQDAEKAVAAQEAAAADANAAGIKWQKEGDQYLSRALSMERDIAAARALGATAGKSQADIDKRVADIRKNYSDIFNDGINSQIEGIKRRGSIEDIVAKRSMDLLSSNHGAGLVNERDYIQQVARLDDAGFDKVRARLESELSLTVKKQNSLKDQAGLRGQIDEVEAQRVSRTAKARNDLNELEVREARQAAENYATVIERQSAVDDKLAQQIVAQRDYNDQIGLTKEGIAALAATRLEERAVLADQNAGIAEGLDLSGTLTKKYQDEAKALRDLAAAQRVGAAKTTASDKFSPKDLEDYLDPAKAKSFGDSLKDAFGGAGDSLTKLRAALQDYGIAQATVEKARAAAAVAFVGDSTKLAAANEGIARKEAQSQINAYGSMAGAAKGFFKEKSAGYKVMEATEKAYRAVELAMEIQTMLTKTGLLTAFTGLFVTAKATEATATVATVPITVEAEGVKQTALATTAMAGAVAVPFPGNLAAFGIVAAMLAAIGLAGFGGGGAKVDIAKERQDKAGTGSVLGDESAKSESIGNSISNLEKYASVELSHSRDMLSALVRIRDTIGVVASLASQTSGLRATALDEKNYGVGSSSGFLGIGASSTTIQDSGIKLNGGQTIGSAINSGVDATGYADIEKKSSGLWGLFSSDKTSRDTIALDDDLKKQFGLLVGSMRDGAIEAVKVLGLSTDGILDKIDAMALGIDEISFKGLSGDEIQKELEAVFSKVGDDIAKLAVPELAQFQQVGEGYLQTLSRVATDYATIDSIMEASGRTFGAVGLASIEARERLIKMAGGLDNLVSSSQSFNDDFLTDSERLAPVQKYVKEQLAAMGLAGVTTRDQFKDVVLGLDVTTDAGAKQYTAMLALAGAFAKTHIATEDLTKSEQDIADERKDLLGQYDELFLTTAQLAEKARSKIAPYNLALYDQVTAQTAVKAAQDTLLDAYDKQKEALKSVVDLQLAAAAATKKQIDALKLGTLSALSPEQKYAEAQRQFNVAAPGDAKNAAAQALLEASRNYNGSTMAYAQDYTKVQAALAVQAASQTSAATIAQHQLTALDKQVGQLIKIEAGVGTLNGTTKALGAAIAALGVANRTASAANIAAGGPSSGKSVEGTIDGLYKSVLGRSADYGGLEFWAGQVRGGMTYDQIVAGLKGSAEYQFLQGITAHAKGGLASGWALVGEEGPEVVNFSQPGRVYTANQSRQMMSGGASDAAIAAQTAAIDRQSVLISIQNDLLAEIRDSTEVTAERGATDEGLRSVKQHLAKTISTLATT